MDRELAGAGLQVALREQRCDGGRIVHTVEFLIGAQPFVLEGRLSSSCAGSFAPESERGILVMEEGGKIETATLFTLKRLPILLRPEATPKIPHLAEIWGDGVGNRG